MSMLGAIIGDICGSTYEFNPVSSKNNIILFKQNSKFTDDTVLTIAIADALLKSIEYKENLIEYTRAYPKGMGYGKRFFRWIFSKEHKPYNSYGNGSAMRVSAIGFYFNSVEEVLDEAKKSAEISHNHPEGIKGAQAVALAIYLARTGYPKQEIKSELESRFHYNFDYTVDEVSASNHHNETCQKSVPEAIVAFFESTDFKSAIVNAIWLRGDADTQACIAGAIAEAYYKEIPTNLHYMAYEQLPIEFVTVIKQFYQYKNAISQDISNKDFQYINSFITIDILSKQILFSENEYTKIKDGFSAMEMEDKWNIIYKNEKLYFMRSWTGHIIYIAYFTKQQNQYLLNQIDINRNISEYENTDDVYEIKFLLYLIKRILLHYTAEYPVRDQNTKHPQLEAWTNVGQGAFENSQEFYDFSLTIKQGNLILEDADFIVNASNTKLMLGSGVSHAFKEHCGGNSFQNYLFELVADRNLVKGDVILSSSGSATNFTYSLHAAVMNYSDKKKDMYPTYEDITKTLQNIIQIVEDTAYTENISSPKIVIPLLGCGTGNLNKLDVYHLIKEAFMHSKIDLELVVYVYPKEDLLLLQHDEAIIK